MDDDDFSKLIALVKGQNPDVLNPTQVIRLREALEETGPAAATSQYLWRAVLSVFVMGVFLIAAWALFDRATTLPMGLLHTSVAAVVAWVLTYAIWHYTAECRTPIAMGVWLWGGLMMLIFLNFSLVVVLASQCVDLTGTSEGFFDTDKCTAPGHEAILRFFLAAKEFGSVLAVALGFISIAWVNFFTRLR